MDPADGPAPRGARLRRLDHERGRRAAVGRRAALVGAVDRARARPALHRLRRRRRHGGATSCASRSRASPTRRATRTRATTSACSTSASTTCAAPGWDPAAYECDLREAPAFLQQRCDRGLVCTLPLDLGRPRAGARGRGCQRARSSARRPSTTRSLRPARLRRAQPGDGRRGASDRVRPGRDRGARAGRARARRLRRVRPRADPWETTRWRACAATPPTSTARQAGGRNATRAGAPRGSAARRRAVRACGARAPSSWATCAASAAHAASSGLGRSGTGRGRGAWWNAACVLLALLDTGVHRVRGERYELRRGHGRGRGGHGRRAEGDLSSP